MNEYRLKNLNILIFNYLDQFYIHKSDRSKINFYITKIKWNSEYFQINTPLNENELELQPIHFISKEGIELFFELNKIDSLVKQNRIEFKTFDNPSSRDCRKSKIYDIYITFEKNKLKIVFPFNEMTLAVHIIFEKICNILIGNLFTLENEFKLENSFLNNKEWDIRKILTKDFLLEIKLNNLFVLEFDKNIEKKSNLLLMIDDKYAYKKKIDDFIIF